MANIGEREDTIIVVPQEAPVQIPNTPAPSEPAVTPEPVKEPVPA